MENLGDALIIGTLEAEAAKLEALSDALQERVLKSPDMNDDLKQTLSRQAATRQQAASDIRKVISTLG